MTPTTASKILIVSKLSTSSSALGINDGQSIKAVLKPLTCSSEGKVYVASGVRSQQNVVHLPHYRKPRNEWHFDPWSGNKLWSIWVLQTLWFVKLMSFIFSCYVGYEAGTPIRRGPHVAGAPDQRDCKKVVMLGETQFVHAYLLPPVMSF